MFSAKESWALAMADCEVAFDNLIRQLYATDASHHQIEPAAVAFPRGAGMEECRSCYWMNEDFRDQRAETWLKGHGGLRARILTDGILKREA
jgi:hypothetical protein